MKVLELYPARRVRWQVVDGPADWVCSKVSFELKQEGEQTTVLFKHQGWSEQSEESSIIAWEGVSTLNLRQR